MSYLQQIPPFFSARRELSGASQPKISQSPDTSGKPSKSGGFFSKFFVGSVVIGAAVMTAYQSGHLDQIIGKEQHSSSQPPRTGDLEVVVPVPKDEETGVDILVVPVLKSGESQENGASDFREKEGLTDAEGTSESSSNVEQKTKPHLDFHHAEDLREKKGENQFPIKDASDLTPDESTVPVHEKEMPADSLFRTTSDDQIADSGTLSEGNINTKNSEAIPSVEHNNGVTNMSNPILDNTFPVKSNTDTVNITEVHVCFAHCFYTFYRSNLDSC